MSKQIKEKLLVTMWRGQLNNPEQYQNIYCRIIYDNTEQTTKPIPSQKSLNWKQTYIFRLSKTSVPLKFDFINKNEQIKEIHFAKEQVLDSLSIGRCEAYINLDDSNRGNIPAKLPILDEEGNRVGIIFVEYEILKTEVNYVVEKMIQYEFMMRMHAFRLSFIRSMPVVPLFYLKFLYGGRMQKEDFPFEQNHSLFFYNFPVQIFIKNQNQLLVEIQVKEKPDKDYRNPNTQLETQTIMNAPKGNKNPTSLQKSKEKQKAAIKNTKTTNSSPNKGAASSKKQNNQIQVHTVDKLWGKLALDFSGDLNEKTKIPMMMMVKGIEREVGMLECNLEVAFKSKKEKQALQAHKRKQQQIKSLQGDNKQKKKVKKYEIPKKNGMIAVNSLMAKLDYTSLEAIKGNKASIELKLGKIIQNSDILDDPGIEIIWMDSFTFKRTWEQTIKFIIYIHSGEIKMPRYYTEMNLRNLFQTGKYMAKKLSLKNQNDAFSGYLTVDVEYKQEDDKPKQPIVKKVKKDEEISPEKVEQMKREEKRMQILERMKKRESEKKKREEENNIGPPLYSERELMLPPLRPSWNNHDSTRSMISPQPQHNVSVNVYNKGGAQKFNKSPRFESPSKDKSTGSYSFRPESDFDCKSKNKSNKGASIGLGDKYDFTKQNERAPGVGRYKIPSVWDKYK